MSEITGQHTHEMAKKNQVSFFFFFLNVIMSTWASQVAWW